MIDVAGFVALPPGARQEVFARLDPQQRAALHAALAVETAKLDPLADLDWLAWNQRVVPALTGTPDAAHHIDFWEWTDRIEVGVRPRPFFAFWPRGHTKSTKTRVAVAKLGLRGVRQFGLYVSATQEQADDHVTSIGMILESDAVAELYPAHAKPDVSEHGSQRGWRRNRLWTAGGLIVDAIGLDTAARGRNLGGVRPDMMVLDDIDDPHASSRVVEKNIRSITNSLIPALQPHAVVMLAQNVVSAGSIASRLIDGRAVFLADAIRSGPFPAVADVEPGPGDPEHWYERTEEGPYRVLRGRPTWPEGMPLETVAEVLTAMGPEAFEMEVQQDTSQRPGAIWAKGDIQYWDGPLPEFERVVVGIDPNKTGRGDDAGVVVVGSFRPAIVDDGGVPVLGRSGRPKRGPAVAVVLADYTGRFRPSEWREMAAKAVIRWGADTIVVEDAGLGEHARLTMEGAKELEGVPVRIREVSASMGKKDRARPVWRYYVEKPTPRIYHAERLPVLEAQMTSFEPDVPGVVSPGALDALVHACTHLLFSRDGAPNMATAAEAAG